MDPSCISDILIKNSRDGILAFDREFRYTVWNPTMEIMSGMKAQDVLGRVAFEIFPWLEELGEGQNFRDALSGLRVHSERKKVFIKELDRHGCYEAYYGPLRNESGEITGGMGVVHDVTRQSHSVEKAYERFVFDGGDVYFRNLIETMPGFVWSSPRLGEVDFINRSGLEYLGAQSVAEGFRNLQRSIHPEDRELYLSTRAEANRTGTPWEIEYRLRRASDGQYRWIFVRTYPLRSDSGTIIRWIGSANEIHDHKMAVLRLERLQSLASRLTGALTPKEVAEIVVAHAGTASETDAVMMAEVSEDGESLRSLASHGHVEEFVRLTERPLPVRSPLPLALAVRTKQPVFLESLSQILETSPEARDVLKVSGCQAVAAFPLIAEGKVIGALGFACRKPQRFKSDVRSFLSTLAAQCAQALERSRLFERERDARARAEAEREKFFSVLQQIPAPIAVTRGVNHIMEFANSNYRAGVASEDIIGKPLVEAHPVLKDQPIMAITDRVYQTGEPFSAKEFEVRQTRPDGQESSYFLSGTLIPLRGPDGGVEGVLSFVFDVTEAVLDRRRIEVNEARLNLALSSSQLGIWEWDLDTNKTWRSRENDILFGLDSLDREWSLDTFMSSVHPDDRLMVQAKVEEAIRESDQFKFEFRIVRSEGAVRWMMDSGRVFRHEDGRARKIVGAILDVTHIKEAEEALKQAKETAEAASRAKTSFVANMSHEFRTPLTAILGYTEFLGKHNLDPVKREAYVDGINRNGRVLIKLIEDILDLSKVEAGLILVERSEFDPRDIVLDVMGMFSMEASRKDIVLKLRTIGPVHTCIYSDPVRLRQILINLVGNAIKFTTKGTVEITMESVSSKEQSATASALIRFCVRDTGIGLAREQVERLFQPFGQADQSTRRKFGGTGLGLFISKRLAEALGGDLVLESSAPETGSSFALTIDSGDEGVSDPLALHSEQREYFTSPETASERSVPRLLDGFRLLIVEDTDDIRNLLRVYLSEAGALVDEAFDGAEALKKASVTEYDAVIMDLHMPVMDGFMATLELKRLGYEKPIVALTARAQPEDREHAARLGFSSYLTKPVALPILIDEIRRLVD